MKAVIVKLKQSLFIAFNFTILCAISINFISCTGEDDELTLDGKYKMAELAGTWVATQANFSSTSQDYKGNIQIVEEGGSVTLQIGADGKFIINILLPDEPLQVFKGLLRFEEEWLTVSYDTVPDDYEYFDVNLSEDKKTLTLNGSGTYDFDDDGIEDPCGIYLVLQRQ